MRIITREEIDAALPVLDLVAEIEQGFVAYSHGRAVVPPVGELVLHDPPGDVHIKYGYITGDDYYVIKVASGFYENPVNSLLPSSNGLMLMFSQSTGELVAILLDEGSLTDIRTAVAGAIAAKCLAPLNVTRIGIIGSGIQARLQLEYLAPVTDCRQVLVWGRNQSRLDAYVAEMAGHGFEVATSMDTAEVMATCNLIVTTTPAEKAILRAPNLRRGMHFTAVGSDTSAKQELATAILGRADLVVADSIVQCLERGDIHHALKAKKLNRTDIVELGSIIAGDAAGRTTDSQVTVADLTGVAVQDIQIASAIYAAVV
ncbi:ornithine cyclodeaminase family protein [Actinomycetota bacterium]